MFFIWRQAWSFRISMKYKLWFNLLGSQVLMNLGKLSNLIEKIGFFFSNFKSTLLYTFKESKRPRLELLAKSGSPKGYCKCKWAELALQEKDYKEICMFQPGGGQHKKPSAVNLNHKALCSFVIWIQIVVMGSAKFRMSSREVKICIVFELEETNINLLYKHL